jgi:hypothetical protein
MKHHIIQEKYLKQWQKNAPKNQLQIYVIPENRYIERGSGWKGFWKDDFNILDGVKNEYYLPEKVTAEIDDKGISAIREINTTNKKQLSGYNRSAIALYTSLQYVRTPKFRAETNNIIEKQIQYFMREDVTSPDKINITKQQVINEKPSNKQEAEAIKKISQLSEKEFQSKVFEAIHSDDIKIRLTKTGHSKQILKNSRLAKKIFQFEWLLLIAPKNTNFATSDSPCFTISSKKIMNGPCSPSSKIIFPLSPKICLYINPKNKSIKESYLNITRKDVSNINKIICLNSYNCIVTSHLAQLKNLTKNFNYKSHKKNREVIIYKKGDYVMFNLE